MPRIKMIHHVNVQISDRERTREWYEKVLGAQFLDRGPALNKRQLQLRIGSGEMHFTETPIQPPSAPAILRSKLMIGMPCSPTQGWELPMRERRLPAPDQHRRHRPIPGPSGG